MAANAYLIGEISSASIVYLLVNIALTGLGVWITNWSCYNQTYNWLAWIIVICTAIPVVFIPYILMYGKSDPELKEIIEEEKASYENAKRKMGV
jgi:hypothetical protein